MRDHCAKRRYRTAIDAQIALSSTAARGKRLKNAAKRREEHRPYLCPLCKGWHLTSKPLGAVDG